MKKVYILALAISITGGVSAQWKNKKIEGNGKRVTEERSTASYDDVSVHGAFDVFLVAGKEGELVVEGEENLLEYVITEVKEDKLVVKVKKGIYLKPSSWKEGAIVITVPVEEISKVSLSGSGDVVGKTTLRTDDLKAGLSGSGDMDIDVEADRTELAISGSGDMKISGKTRDLSISISGSGDVRAYSLEADTVEANVSGSADIQVTANEFLKAKVSGSGDIFYKGNARVESRTSGSGDVTKVN